MQKWARISEYGIVDIGTLPKQHRADGELHTSLHKLPMQTLNAWGFYAYEDNPPSFDERVERLASTLSFDGTSASVEYVKIPHGMETLKERKAQELAEARWRAETGGVDGIRTDRESQALVTGAALKAMQDETYSCRWKTEAGFTELTAPQILAIADAVRTHVQACFDREAELLALVEAAETVEEVEAVLWSMPASS